MKRQASAQWGGSFKEGKGTITTDSGVLVKTPYSFVSRIGDGPGTSAEELIAAAHAACFSMGLAAELGASGIEAHSIHTTATVTLEKQPRGVAATQLHLDVSARIPGVDRLDFERAAENTKKDWLATLPFKGKLTVSVNLSAW